jgi:hypothetical protein
LPPSPTSSSSCSSATGQMGFVPQQIQVFPGGVGHVARNRYESSPGAGLHLHGPQSPYNKPQPVSRPSHQQRSATTTSSHQQQRARVMLGPASAPVHAHTSSASPLSYGTAIYETSSSSSFPGKAYTEEEYFADDHHASPCLPGFMQHLILPSSTTTTTSAAAQVSPSWPSSDSDVADDLSVSDSSSCASGPFSSSSSSSRHHNNIWSLDGEETKMLHGGARLTWLGL